MTREDFATTLDVSCWTFLRMAKLAEPLMHSGGALFTMSYYGSQVVVQNYNIMGVAKAALESAVRYLAAELGPKGIRVNAISPGPLATRAASGIPDFDALLEKAKSKAPARSLVDIDDVGAATAFLAHDAAKLITGETSIRRWRISHHRLTRLSAECSAISSATQAGRSAALNLDHHPVADAQALFGGTSSASTILVRPLERREQRERERDSECGRRHKSACSSDP